MIKIIRSNQKIFMALGSVVLMLMFVLNRGNGPTEGTDQQVGTIDGKPLMRSDLAEAHAEAQMLDRLEIFPFGKDQQGVSMLRFYTYFHKDLQYYVAAFANQAADKPEWFALLRNEARATVAVPTAEVDSIMQQTDLTQGQSENYDAVKQAVTDFLLVGEKFSQLQDKIKVSQPMVNRELATTGQTISIGFIQIPAASYTARVPAPTTQQLQTQFDQFSNTLPGQPMPGSNPFGFGYKYPVRYKVQYISIPSASVSQVAIGANPKSFTWEVEARKYYLNHEDDYRNPPATQPTTQPVIKPFEQVEGDILKTIQQPKVESLKNQVQAFVNSQLQDAWRIYQQYTSDKNQTVEPDAGFGQRYTSYSFLVKLAEAVKTKFNVTIIVNDMDHYASEKELSKLNGLNDPSVKQFVLAQASDYLKNADLNAQPVIAKLMSPSPPITTTAGDTVILARVVGVLPSQAPSNLAAVQPQVDADLRAQAAYAMAKADADNVLAIAKKSSLLSAGIITGRTPLATRPGQPLSMVPTRSEIKPTDVVVPPLDTDENTFITKAFELLKNYDPKTNANPLELIELPDQGRVFVAQLSGLNVTWTPENYYQTVMEIRQETARDLLGNLAADWFDFDQITKRTKYKPAKA